MCPPPPRFQKLRKKAGLTVSDVVEMYLESEGEQAAATLGRITHAHSKYLTESLGCAGWVGG